jgi:hypothetical protein
LDQLVTVVRLDQLEAMKVQLVLQASLVLQGQRVHKVLKGYKEYKVREGQQEHKEYKVPLVILERKGLLVQLVYKVLKD